MKLERLSENQIRCTLNKADLADRELMLNELAYGTDKAKELFREMMEQAADELGFEVNDIPLMIEAIPVSPDCLILIITKVEDREELDTRFSRFSKYTSDIEVDNESDDSNESDDTEDNLNIFENANSLMETISDIVENMEQAKKQGNSDGSPNFVPLSAALRENNAKKKQDKNKGRKKDDKQLNYRIFSFQNINDISKAAAMVAPIYHDNNSLYKSPNDNLYYLIVNHEATDMENYQRACNLLSEYGTKVKSNYAMPYYFAEHFKMIIKGDAIQTLASI